MATINLGNIKFNWKGAYNAGTAYAVDDVVSYNGSSYVCILASTNNLPTNTTYWNVMSNKGTDADLLNITGTVQGDLYYNNGSAIARLGAGTSGQFLKTLGTGANPVWGDAGGTNTPAWSAYMNTDMTSISNDTWTTVQYNDEHFDTDNAFDTSNYRFTVPSGKAGKYFVQWSVHIGGVGDNNTQRMHSKLNKNGSTAIYGLNQDMTADADAINHNTAHSSGLVDLAVGDYLEVQAFQHFQNVSSGRFMGGSNATTRFCGFKLI